VCHCFDYFSILFPQCVYTPAFNALDDLIQGGRY